MTQTGQFLKNGDLQFADETIAGAPGRQSGKNVDAIFEDGR